MTALRVYRAMWGKVSLKWLARSDCNTKKYVRFFRRIYVCIDAYNELRMKVMRKRLVPLGEETESTPITKEYERKYKLMKRRADKKAKAHKKYITRKKLPDPDTQPITHKVYERLFGN